MKDGHLLKSPHVVLHPLENAWEKFAHTGKVNSVVGWIPTFAALAVPARVPKNSTRVHCHCPANIYTMMNAASLKGKRIRSIFRIKCPSGNMLMSSFKRFFQMSKEY